ncbi:MAG: Undecaprenyl-phosphate galactosephosphotransferase [Microgenomates group bacterium GW2011_GWA2_46_7]|nr:MAG: Undecaprenyl-phosphate galactosephosphotransferase [Microgenomates group bacterium GW2011_GWA2_46_7]
MNSNNFTKRVLDVVVATTLAIVFLPVWLTVPLLIVLSSPGPIIYRHKRIGQNGKTFHMYKFRSMVVGADDILHKKDKKLLKKFKKLDWKLEAKDDPRITSLGRILRALTIDEFPQLYNVLVGDMSMVGPRAYLERELKEQIKKYPGTKKLMDIVITAKPGITGLWQVSGRNEISFDKRAALDAQYVHTRSFWNDLVILWKTPQAMISKW